MEVVSPITIPESEESSKVATLAQICKMLFNSGSFHKNGVHVIRVIAKHMAFSYVMHTIGFG